MIDIKLDHPQGHDACYRSFFSVYFHPNYFLYYILKGGLKMVDGCVSVIRSFYIFMECLHH